VRKLKSKPSNPKKLRRRVEAAVRKAERVEKLTGRELMIVPWVKNG
jgi:hypothetical protein